MRVPISPSIRFACLLLTATACGVERPVAPDDGAAVSAALLSGAPSQMSAWPLSDVAVQLYWQDNTAHEDGYEIQRADGSTGSFVAITRVAVNSTSHADGDRAELTEYCYRVRAYRTRGSKTTYSDFSNTACAKTLGPPSAPSSVRALPGSYGGIEVLWTDNSTVESGFHVRRTTAAGTTSATVWANSTSYTEWGVPIEEELCYQVVAFNSYGESEPSNSDCIGLPAAPVNIRPAGVSSRTIDLTWDDVSSFEDGFEVQAMYCYWYYPYYYYYSPPPEYVCNFSHVAATVGSNITAYQVTGLWPSVTYSYQVVAFRQKEGRKWYSGSNGVLDVTTEPEP
jgi:hypothetical protein